MQTILLRGRASPTALRVAHCQQRVHPRRCVVPRSAAAGEGNAGDLLKSATEGAQSLQASAASAASSAQAQTADAVTAAVAAATSVADAAREAALQLARESSSKLDASLADVAASAGALKARAGKGAKEAAAAVDELAGTAIDRAITFKAFFAHGDAALEAGVDEAVGHFVARANKLRSQLATGTKASDVIDQMLAALEDCATELKVLVANAAAASVDGLSNEEVRATLPMAAPLTGGAPRPASAGPVAAASGGLGQTVADYLQLWVALGSLYYIDLGIKKVLIQYGIAFPSALVGMFGVFALLCVVGDKAADAVLSFYSRALSWIARWLPLFYVPALVTLPLALAGIPGADIARIVGILSVGMVATLLFTAQTTVFIREAVKTPVKEIVKAKPAPPFLTSHYAAWGAVAAASLAATLASRGGELGAQMALPFGLACTVGGYLIGERVPRNLQGALHPVVVTALVANAGAALHGALMGWSYKHAQKVYLAKGSGPLGAGDLLMSLLGVVIISFGFRVYTQRNTMRRHAPEIFGATILSAVFSLFSTAFAAKALGLPSDLSRALIPRSVTVALALPIAQGLEAPLAITAAAVLLQGILGANFGPGLMTAAGVKDTIARGLAAAGTAGGLGTASLTSKEPEALPFCALSYALVGIFSTVVCSVPVVRGALLGIVG